MDKEQYFEWYPDCKVYFDGSNYIALPKTHNPARRRKPHHKVITVVRRDDKYVLAEKPKVKLEEDIDDEESPFDDVQVTVDEVIERQQKGSETANDAALSAFRIQTTAKDIFEELYDRYMPLKYGERRARIFDEMRNLFKSEEAAIAFIDDNFRRRRRNVIARRQRFVRKAYNQKFQYFVTFTYDDRKHDEASFKKKLVGTLSNFARRKGWLYMGVWERGNENGRVHFHGFLYVPEGAMCGRFEEVTDYNRKSGKLRTIVQNTFFVDRFGRNEFEEIGGPLYGQAMAYIMKYMEKQNAAAVYSKGLYSYFHSDICGDDVICKLKPDDETDNRLILFDDFTCVNEGEILGKVSKDTIAKLPKTV